MKKIKTIKKTLPNTNYFSETQLINEGVDYDNANFYSELAEEISKIDSSYDCEWMRIAQEIHDLYLNYENEQLLDNQVLSFYPKVRIALKKNLVSILNENPKKSAKVHEELWHESHFDAYMKSGFKSLSEEEVIDLIRVIGLKRLLSNYSWTIIAKSAKVWLKK